MNLINELRMLAEDLYSAGGHNRYSAAMSKAADELAKWEAVFGHLGDTPDECGNAIIAARDELEERLKDAEAEALEEARLNGIGAERELALMARIERLERALRAMTKGYKSVAYAQWPPEMHLANEVLRENT